jgi:hypothetical protein
MAFSGLIKANNLSDIVNKEKAWDNLGSNFASEFSAAPPSVDFNFAANKSLVDNVSGNNPLIFSRASIGTYVDANGIVQTAASGVPRFTHSRSTGASIGLLIEESRSNYLFDYSSPTYNNCGAIYSSYLDTRFGSNQNAHSWTIPTAQTNPELGWFNPGNIGTGTVNQKSFSFWAKADRAMIMRGDFGYYTLTTEWQWFSFTSDSSSGAHYCRWLYSGQAQTIPAGFRFDVAAVNLEIGGSPSSYIRTSGALATRSADSLLLLTSAPPSTIFSQLIPFGSSQQGIVSINNNSSSENWEAYVIGTTAQMQSTSSGVAQAAVAIGTITPGQTVNVAISLGTNVLTGSANGFTGQTSLLPRSPVTSQVQIGRTQSGISLNSALARLSLWQVPFTPILVQALSSAGVNGTFTAYQTVKGKDVLILNNVRAASSRDFTFTKGLTSSAQTRITTASQDTVSAVTLSNALLLKQFPSSTGNYFVSSGNLSASSLKINGIAAASLLSSPFSGSTALFPLTFTTMELSSNFRLVPLFVSGTVTSPTIGVPIETSDLYLYAKAGQN